MRVALVTAHARAGDAVGQHVAEQLAFFHDRGADVRVLAESDRHVHSGVRAALTVLTEPQLATDAGRFLATSDLVIFVYSQYFPLLGFLPLLVGGRPRLVVDYLGVTPPALWDHQGREALEQGERQRGLVWCADAAVAHSRFTRQELQRVTGFPGHRIADQGYALDLDHFTPGTPFQSLHETLGLDNAQLLLFVGRLAVNKRVPVLVEALARLRDLTPPVHAVVIGDDGDIYRTEATRCSELAERLGVARRLHLLGRVTREELRDAYRSADVFVMPSRHEGCCLPVLEAMACGLPVVAARATALPETVADAGLSFVPDDVDDLVRQVRRVLQRPVAASPGHSGLPSCLRVAVAAFRYGTDFVGGAETSLRTAAQALHAAGHQVEVFTTCTRSEAAWANELPVGTSAVDGITVHRFRLDDHDRARHLESVRAILESEGAVAPEQEAEYLAHSIHSARLVDALCRRQDEFDAVLVGPYLFGLTFDVARTLPGKTLLVPCFHDEPFARLRSVLDVYERVGGILYHSPEERQFAEAELGLNHPGAIVFGTRLDLAEGDPGRGRALVGTGRRHIVYCGRYSQQKNVPLLIERARRYAQLHPERFTFVFVGQGEVTIPTEPWARDLGFVNGAVKRDILAGAAALVQPSQRESLSLVALEAWAQGVPVIADAGCAVLRGQLQRSNGGCSAADEDEFVAALDDLWEHPEHWRDLGRQGREHVRMNYGSTADYTARLEGAIRDLRTPLLERLRQRGRQRVAAFARPAWRECFAAFVEQVLDAPARPCRENITVSPRGDQRAAPLGARVLVPVQVVNRGTHAAAHDGPGRLVLRCRVRDASGRDVGAPAEDTPLPALLRPEQVLAAAVPVRVPATPGAYQVTFRAERTDRPSVAADGPPLLLQAGGGPATGCCAPLLDGARQALAEAQRLERLPDGYTDVTEGLFAGLKRWCKRKLLGNFRRAYVDVLSRQQTTFNGRLLTAVTELAECCATLDHAGGQRSETAELGATLAALQDRLSDLEDRLARLEAGASFTEEIPS